MLPNSFYSKRIGEWDSPTDPDDVDFQTRRDDLYRAFTATHEVPPYIGCVKDLKEARAWLACLTYRNAINRHNATLTPWMEALGDKLEGI